MWSTFSEHNALNDKPAWRSWKVFLNREVKTIYKPDRDRRAARYTSTYRLLTSYMEKDYSLFTFARRRTTSDFWVETIGATTGLDNAGDEKLIQPLALGRYILTGCNFLEQTEHNGFEVRDGRSPGLSSRFQRLNGYLC